MANINPKATSELKPRTKPAYQKITDHDTTKSITVNITKLIHSSKCVK